MELTLKAPRQTASENVVCLCRLLNILANFLKLFFAYRQTVWTQIIELIEPSHLDLCCLQKPIIIACGSESVKLAAQLLVALSKTQCTSKMFNEFLRTQHVTSHGRNLQTAGNLDNKRENINLSNLGNKKPNYGRAMEYTQL